MKFEGKYINGKKQGYCKDYNENNRLDFEGEYWDDLKNGYGKEYDIRGKLIFEGEYVYNYKIIGKEYYLNKLEYEGEYLYEKNGMVKDMMKKEI